MKIREKTLGPENPEFASSVNSLAILYRHQVPNCRTQYPCHLRERSRLTTTTIFLIVVVRATHQQGLYDKAEPLYIRALRVRQKIFGEIHADIAQSFNSRTCSALAHTDRTTS